MLSLATLLIKQFLEACYYVVKEVKCSRRTFHIGSIHKSEPSSIVDRISATDIDAVLAS